MPQISDYELELMKVIWTAGGTALYAEIAAALTQKGFCWSKNTVVTLLSRLTEKGLLTASKVGRKNRYTAQVSARAYQAEQAQSFLSKIFEGDAKGLVSTLIETEQLSPADYDDLKRYWEQEAGT